MRIKQHRQCGETISHHQHFWFVDHIGSWGYSFECNERGDVLPSNPTALDNYRQCLTGIVNGQAVVRGEIERRLQQWTTAPIGVCVCKRDVHLGGFTNTCDCGRDYDMSGQLLAPRSQWGEETGEHWSDCY